MQKFKYPKTLDVNMIELITFQLEYILMDYRLKKTQLKILAYVYVYGTGAITELIKEGLLTNAKTAENYISGLRKLGLVHGLRNSTKIHPNIKVFEEDIEFSIKLQLKDNIND